MNCSFMDSPNLCRNPYPDLFALGLKNTFVS